MKIVVFEKDGRIHFDSIADQNRIQEVADRIPGSIIVEHDSLPSDSLIDIWKIENGTVITDPIKLAKHTRDEHIKRIKADMVEAMMINDQAKIAELQEEYRNA